MWGLFTSFWSRHHSPSGLLELRFLSAASTHNFHEYDYCISQGVNINCAHEKDGNTALHSAAEKNDLLVAVRLLRNPNINIQMKNYHGNVPLHLSLEYPNHQMVKILLRRHANPNIPDRFGNTALHTAARLRSMSLAQLLVKYKAEVNVVNAMEHTPLHLVVLETPFLAMVQLLVQHGANINICSGNMPLLLEATLYCNTYKRLEIIKYLIEKGIKLDAVDRMTQRNALHIVAMTGYCPLAEQLLKYGADSAHKDYLGKLPIDIAAEHGNHEVFFLYEN